MKAGALEHTELFNVRAYRPASSWNEWKTVKSGYRVDSQGKFQSQWHWLSSALRLAVKLKKNKTYRVFNNCVLRIHSTLVTRTKSKNENKEQELLRISQESGPEGIQRCGLKDYKKWLVWWDWPFKLKWQVARPPLHLGAYGSNSRNAIAPHYSINGINSCFLSPSLSFGWSFYGILLETQKRTAARAKCTDHFSCQHKDIFYK